MHKSDNLMDTREGLGSPMYYFNIKLYHPGEISDHLEN